MPEPPRIAVRILIRLPVCSGSRDLIAINRRPSGVITHLMLITSRSNTSLAGVKVTSGMSARITMSPLYRVQQDMPHEEE
jgi:hypothetical protein